MLEDDVTGDGGEAGFYATMKVVGGTSPALNSSAVLGITLDHRSCVGTMGASLCLCQVPLAQWEVPGSVPVPRSGWQRRQCWCLLCCFKCSLVATGTSPVQ